jgi:hypothetical protein
MRNPLLESELTVFVDVFAGSRVVDAKEARAFGVETLCGVL